MSSTEESFESYADTQCVDHTPDRRRCELEEGHAGPHSFPESGFDGSRNTSGIMARPKDGWQGSESPLPSKTPILDELAGMSPDTVALIDAGIAARESDMRAASLLFAEAVQAWNEVDRSEREGVARTKFLARRDIINNEIKRLTNDR